MEILIRFIEAAIFVVCVCLVVQRYRADSIRIVPADVLLWTVSVFFVAALAIDAVGIVNPYRVYPTLGTAFADPLVRVLAAVTVLVLVVAAVAATKRAERIETAQDPHPEPWRKYRGLWLTLSFLPPMVALFAPDPSAYLTFGAPFVLRGAGETFADPQGAATQYNILVVWSAYGSCLGFALWVHGRRSAWAWSLAPLVLSMDLWIVGKRYIIAVFLMAVVFAAVTGRPLPGAKLKKLALQAGALLGILLVFSVWYQATYRPFLIEKGDRTETLLTDYTRLDVVRLALASQTGLGVQRPLEYPGQSPVLHFQAITSGSDDYGRVPYGERVTSIAMGKPIQPLGGAMTTSLVSEAIDNVGVLGMLLGPAILAALAVAMSYRADAPLRLFGALAVSTLCVVHILAVLPIVVLAVGRLLQLVILGHGKRADSDRVSVQRAPASDG